MDDGSCKWKDKVLSLRFCTDCYSESEIDFLVNIMKEKFDLEFKKTRHNQNKWRLYLGVKDYFKIKELIYPHIIPSMLYKFPV